MSCYHDFSPWKLDFVAFPHGEDNNIVELTLQKVLTIKCSNVNSEMYI